MSDLYNIPGDNGIDYRLRKFVEYQHGVPSIHYRFAGEWAKKYNYDKNRAVRLCWYLSVTYNEITAILLDFLAQGMSDKDIWGIYKEKLNFGSARKYAKNNDEYVPLMKRWASETKGSPYLWLQAMNSGNPYENYKRISACLRSWKFVGRFASDIFLEGISYLGDYLQISTKETAKIDWKNGANLTSGIFNIFYEDEKAQKFEKTHKVTAEDALFLSRGLKKIQEEIRETYPDQDSDIQAFVGKICSFRNLFKGARYGGFHHDRQLGVIRGYEEALPQYCEIYRKCFELRKEMFPEHLLGELNGWDGIRKERKKLWLTTGLTGVEKRDA